MTNPDRAKAILLVSATGFSLWFLFQTVAQCHADGGTTVRGLIWLECIK
jgi:hypothetical protein